jgi:hypothetical protein
MIDAEKKLKSVRRELAFRKALYPKWVADGRIDKQRADEEIAIMEAIAKDYQDYIDTNAEWGKLL